MAGDIKDTKILLVDNASEVRNMREQLRDLGFNTVSEMTNGLQVITEIKKNPPDMMFVNLNLPKYSGLQVFKSVMADKALARIKFVMVTPKMNRRELADMEKDGIDNYLQRPFTVDDLKDKIYTAYGMGGEAMKMAAEELAKEAKALFDEGKWEEAVKAYSDANASTESAEYCYMQGRCYLEMGLKDQAIAAFQNTIKIDHKHPEVDHWLGVALQQKKEYNASIQALERAAKQPGAGADTHVAKGKSHLGADQVDQANQSFDRAIRLDPDDVTTRTNVGNAYLEKGMYDKAESTFGDAINIQPENIPLYNRMAIALRKQGKYKEAINLYIKAINIAPADEGLYYNLARALHESGDKAKALKAIEKALKLDPEFPEAIELRKEYMGEAK